MATVLDKEQTGTFPALFERFKTDGVEHNLYIGASISFKALWLNVSE
jgi:hypothetical protein